MLIHTVFRELCELNQVVVLACKPCNYFRVLRLLLVAEEPQSALKKADTKKSQTIFRNWNLIQYFSEIFFFCLLHLQIPKVISIVSLVWQITAESTIFIITFFIIYHSYYHLFVDFFTVKISVPFLFN